MKKNLKYIGTFVLFQMVGILVLCSLPFVFELIASFILWKDYDCSATVYRTFGLIGSVIGGIAYIGAYEKGDVYFKDE